MTGVQTCALPICFPVTIFRSTLDFSLDSIIGFVLDPTVALVLDSMFDSALGFEQDF